MAAEGVAWALFVLGLVLVFANGIGLLLWLNVHAEGSTTRRVIVVGRGMALLFLLGLLLLVAGAVTMNGWWWR